jgi:hypothetical protein
MYVAKDQDERTKWLKGMIRDDQEMIKEILAEIGKRAGVADKEANKRAADYIRKLNGVLRRSGVVALKGDRVIDEY